MASSADHEQQASRNRDFYDELGAENAARPEWAITALFYTAVQEVQAVIVRKGWKVQRGSALQFPGDHVERLRVISRECPQIESDFRSLKNWSEGARYECQVFGPGHLQLAKGVLDRISAELAKLA